MIEVLRDDEGRITAVCEWLTFGEDGRIEDKGRALFIGEFEVNPEHRSNGVFKKLARQVAGKNPQAEKAFWFREYKYPGRGARIVDMNRIIRRIGG